MNNRCIFLIVPSMHSGGQERVVSRWTEILKDNYEIRVVLFDDKAMDYPLTCEKYSLELPSQKGNPEWSKLMVVLKRIWKVRKLIAKDKPFTIVSFGHGANLVNVFASVGLSKSIVSIRGYESLNQLKKFKGSAERFIIGKAHRILCVSKVMADELAGLMPAKKDRIRVQYNVFDLEDIKKLAVQNTELDSWFAENQVLISVGTLRPEKGYWHLIKAFSLMKKDAPNLRLLHIGPDAHGYGATLKKLARDLGLEEDIRFLGYRDNPYQYIARSKMFLLSSITEGFPNVLIEAMACGVPVIASDCKTGPREILSNDDERKTAKDIEMADYGILVPVMNKDENYDPNSIEACDKKLAEAAERLLCDATLTKKYAAQALKRANDFSIKTGRREIIKMIEE